MPRKHDPREIKDVLYLDDIEKSRDHPEHLRPDEEGGVIHRPPRQDPRFADQSVLPGHDDVPAGSRKNTKRMPPR